jgi:general secretion pathway protein K
VLVLWAVLVVGLILQSILGTTRTEAWLTRNRHQFAELGAILDAAINITLLRMLDLDAESRTPIDGSPFPVSFAGHVVAVRVRDEAGKIDLNFARPELLRALLIAAGTESGAADAIVDQILDWREPGIGKRLNGGKAEEYRAAGLVYGPRNGPFQSVAELRLVIGMTAGLFDRIAPAFTVYSQTSWVDPALAPAEVLGALPAPSAGASLPGASAPDRRASQRIMLGHAFTVSAETADSEPVRVQKTAVVRLTGSTRVPLWVYRWD